MKRLIVAFAALALLGNGAEAENKTCGGLVAEENVSYNSSDGTPLAAAYIRPRAASEGFPGMVLIQGSGTSDRNNGWARAFAEELAGCGIAVMLTDKRGSGASGGDWRTASFEHLAADAVAGLDALESQSGVDINRTGFLGLSQGGMIAPLAAQFTSKADVMVNVSGGVVPLEESLLYELEQTYRQRDIPQDVADRLQEMARASFAYLRDARAWSRYVALRNSFTEGKYAAAIESWPEEQDDPYWDFWRNNFEFDSAAHWRAAAAGKRIPALVIFGKEDSQDNVDVARSVNRFVEATRDAPIAITAVYSGTGHLLVEQGAGRLKPVVVKQIADFVFARGALVGN